MSCKWACLDMLCILTILDASPCVLKGPQIVTVPTFDTPSRYWIVPFLDAYLNFYGAIGSYFNSTAGQYLVVGRSTYACSICQELICMHADHKWGACCNEFAYVAT